jgi:hypothetical protein
MHLVASLDQEMGLIVPVGDAEALVRAMERLGSDPGLRATLGSKGMAAYQQGILLGEPHRTVGETVFTGRGLKRKQYVRLLCIGDGPVRDVVVRQVHEADRRALHIFSRHPNTDMVRNYLKKLYHKYNSFALCVNLAQHSLICLRSGVGMRRVFQGLGTTRLDRRPEVFRAVRSELEGRDVQKILCYGCSTGEEAFTLTTYFPEARIYGTDIDRYRLRVARANNHDPRITFFLSNQKNLKAYGPYDLISAQSVFLRHPEDTRVSNLRLIFPFKTFEKGVAVLVQLLRINGLLVIVNANYRVMDTYLADQLQVVPCPDIRQEPQVPLFDRNGDKQPFAPYHEQVFRRVK